MASNRYVGEYPVIGIRPIVDGRRGPMQLRESLEPQVWAMAEAAKKLFEENLYYSNGEPVKVVMADTCIGRVPETAACADKFRREGVSITLSVTPCWCYGSETMDMDPHTIKGVWGFNGTERPGAVYLAAVLAGHAQKGLPAFGIYGHEVQDLDQITDIPADVFTVNSKSKGSIAVYKDANGFVALNCEISEDLMRAGLCRDIVRQCQVFRKNAGFDVSDRIYVQFVTDAELVQSVLDEKKEQIASDLLATFTEVAEPEYTGEIDLDGAAVKVLLRRV